jgi:hypothetical protein
MLALPQSGRRAPSPPRTLLLGLRSYRLMRQSRVALLYFGLLASFEKFLQVATSPCCYRDSPDVISANLSSDAWSHAPAVPQTAYACYFVCVIGLPLGRRGLASRFYRETTFPRKSFRGCRHFFMFKPPSLLASQVVPTAVHTATGQLRLLGPGRTCFVASTRTGHANRPNTGN